VRRVMAARENRHFGGKPYQAGAAFHSIPWPPNGYGALEAQQHWEFGVMPCPVGAASRSKPPVTQ